MPVAFAIFGLISLIGSVLLLDDGLDFIIDTLEAVFHDARYAVKLAVHHTRRYARMAANAAIGLVIVYALCVVGLTISLIGQWTVAVIGISIAMTVIAAIFFSVLNWITVVVKRPGPSVLATITLIPLPIAFWAAVFPFHFYEWFLAAYGLFMIIGFAVIILGRLRRSTVFLGPYAITGILVVSGILAVLVFAFPQQARAAVIEWKISNRDTGRESLAKEISLRPEDKVTAKKLYWWKVRTDSSGKEHASRYLENGMQKFSVEGDVFKTVRSSADSVETGQVLVQAYFKDSSTGEYMLLDGMSEDDLPWLAASGTTASGSVTAKTDGMPGDPQNGGIKPPSKFTGMATVDVPASTQKYDTGIDLDPAKRYQISYVSGLWSNTSGSGNIRTDGKGSGSWGSLVVPNAPFRSLIGYVDSAPFAIGNNYSGKPGAGRLYLGMNDIPGLFGDNFESIQVKITALN